MVEMKKRIRFYNRHSRKEYLSWLRSKLDFDDDKVVSLKTRSQIDAVLFPPTVQEVSIEEEEEEPSWVKAATEAVLGKKKAETEPKPEPETEEAPKDSPFSFNEYDSCTIRELQDVCRHRGLTIRGTKADVVLRLRRDDEGITEAQPTDDEAEAPLKEAVEASSDAPTEEVAVTEEVTDNESSEQKQNIDEEE
jgi:hypothetical protein